MRRGFPFSYHVHGLAYALRRLGILSQAEDSLWIRDRKTERAISYQLYKSIALGERLPGTQRPQSMSPYLSEMQIAESGHIQISAYNLS